MKTNISHYVRFPTLLAFFRVSYPLQPASSPSVPSLPTVTWQLTGHVKREAACPFVQDALPPTEVVFNFFGFAADRGFVGRHLLNRSNDPIRGLLVSDVDRDAPVVRNLATRSWRQGNALNRSLPMQ